MRISGVNISAVLSLPELGSIVFDGVKVKKADGGKPVTTIIRVEASVFTDTPMPIGYELG